MDDLTEKKKENLTLDELEKSWMARNNISAIFISATRKSNIEILRDQLYKKVKEIHSHRYPYNNFLY